MQHRDILASWPIRAKLLLLILIIFVPASGLILWMGLEHRKNEIEEAKQYALHLVQNLSALQEQFANGTKQMLMTLAQLPEVKRLDADACSRLFRDIHKRHSYYSTIAAVTPSGDLFASSTPFEPGGINISEHKHVRDAVSSLEFSVGEYGVGKATQVRSIHYSYPVFDSDKKLVAIVIAGFKLDDYSHFIEKANLPEKSVVVICDHRGRRLYRLPESNSTPLGESPSEGFRRLMGNLDEGIFERMADDGVYRISAFKRLSLREGSAPYLVMFVGIPKDPFMQSANAEMMRSLSILGIAAFTAMTLAWFYGNIALAKPIGQLVAAAQRLGGGEMGTRTGVSHTPDELGRLAESFDDMALMLEVRSIERQEAEEELRKSEEKYRTVVEKANDCILILQNEKTVYCNPNYVRLIGFDLSEIEDLGFFDIVVPEDRERVHEYYVRRIRGEAARDLYEFTLRTKRGVRTAVEAKPCLIEYNGKTATMIVLRDITERKRAQEALAESEARYRAVVEDQTELITRFSAEGTITFVNSAYCRFFGTQEKESLGRALWHVAHEEDQEDIRKHIDSLCARQPTGMIEYRVVASGGKVRWVQWVNRIILGAEGQVLGYQGVGRDVTDLRMAQQKLEETTQRLQLAVASGHMGIWDWNMKLNELTWDDGMLKLYGISKDSLPMRIEGWEGTLYRDDLSRTHELIQAALRGEREYDAEFRILRPDGAIRILKANGLVIRDDDGRPVRMIGLSRDITERTRAEEALRGSRERLQFLSSRLLSAQEEERRRIAVEIHDGIGSSLSAVKMALEKARSTLREEGVSTESFDTPITWTQYAIDEARRLMTDLRPSILDDMGLVATTAWFLRHYRTIHPHVHVEDEIRAEESDIPEALKTVIFRIMQEAFHNITKHSRAEFITLSLVKRDGAIELAIEDNGEGFDVQAALRTSSVKKGLGLTSMKERAELSGGTFSIESVQEEGTLIRATWPSDG